MIKALKWAYNLGVQHERERMEQELYRRLGLPPEEPGDDLPSQRSYERYESALARWRGVQAFLNAFFGHHEGFDPDRIEKLLEDRR